MATILVVDDEDGLRDMLCDALRIADFTAMEASDGREALKILETQPIDLVVADVNMPVMDGFEMLAELRKSNQTMPVILLTAQSERNDVTKGLHLGADDYVKKPFGLEELLLRIQAVLRRTSSTETPVALLQCGPIVLSQETHTVTFNGKIVDISPTEFQVLHLLLAHKGKVVRKATLLSEVWGINFQTTTNVVDTYISYLRKKLHREGFEGIKTIRGVGFQIDEK